MRHNFAEDQTTSGENEMEDEKKEKKKEEEKKKERRGMWNEERVHRYEEIGTISGFFLCNRVG